MEVDMSGKIIAAVAAAFLLASTGLASARTQAFSHEPFAGTVWDGVVPYGSNDVRDPYAGTIWEGVAPY
jgi:hypothetical protein